MKTKRKLLSLAISALLTTGVASYPMTSYAVDGDNHSNNNDNSNSNSNSNSNGNSSSNSSDSDKRSANDSGDKTHQKITICHVPPGNPANKHTIHIAFSAWPAHKAHTNTNTTGQPLADYLGSCNNRPITSTSPAVTTQETLHVISGCTGTYHDTLATKVQSYFDPIIVADTALDDQNINTTVSECLDKGDSSDSGHNHENNSHTTTGGKGQGHDSVSDSGHHRIRGCQNKDTHLADSNQHNADLSNRVSDSDRDPNNQNYHKQLKDFDHDYDKAQSPSINDPVVVSDSSLNDASVWTEYKKCVAKAGDPSKIDPAKTGNKKGDSGHRHHILSSCANADPAALRTAIATYKAKTNTKDIILTQTSYNDVSIQHAIADCVDASKGKGKDTIATPPSNQTINGTISGATITNATITNGVITAGTVTTGTSSAGTVIGGTITAGTSSGGTTSGGTTSGGTTSGGTTTGATITGATVIGATVTTASTGFSGRQNFREDATPVKQ